MTAKKILLGLIGVLIMTGAMAQGNTALNGRRCPSGQLFFDLNLNPRFGSDKLSHLIIEDSVFILMPRSYNVYLKAYNPLHYTHKEGMKTNLSQVELGVNVFLTKLSESNVQAQSTTKSFDIPSESVVLNFQNELGNEKAGENETKSDKSIGTSINKVIGFVKKDTSKLVHGYIKSLIDMTFDDEIETKKELKQIKGKVKALDVIYKNAIKDYDRVVTLLNFLTPDKKNFNLTAKNEVNEYLTKQLLTQVKNVMLEQHKRVTNLIKLIESMESVVNSWKSFHRESSSEWFIEIEANFVENDETKELNIELTSHRMSYSLSEEKLTKDDLKKKTKHYKLTRFHWLKPQIYAGTIYSFQNRKSYFASLNENGELVVDATDQKPLEKVNLAMVMNWNMYTNNSTVTPFLQAGVALNQNVPMALVGGGMSFSFGSNKSLALSGGVSITGIEELDGLQIGEQVTSTREVEDALEYVGAPLKAYIGIEIKF